MQISAQQRSITSDPSDCIVINLFEGVTTPGGATGAVDKALDGAISRLIASGDFTGKADTSAVLYTAGQIGAARVLVVGLGPPDKFNLIAARRAAAVAGRALGRLSGVKSYATIVHGAGIGGLNARAAAQATAEGALLSAYQPPQYRRTALPAGPQTCSVLELDAAKLAAIQAGVAAGASVATAVTQARNYVSEPGNILNPQEFAARASAMAAATVPTVSAAGATVTVAAAPAIAVAAAHVICVEPSRTAAPPFAGVARRSTVEVPAVVGALMVATSGAALPPPFAAMPAVACVAPVSEAVMF